jgi:hypothetical protein
MSARTWDAVKASVETENLSIGVKELGVGRKKETGKGQKRGQLGRVVERDSVSIKNSSLIVESITTWPGSSVDEKWICASGS